MGNLLAPDELDPRAVSEIAAKLTEVEVLYILASKPAAVAELLGRVRNTFGLEADPIQIEDVVDTLDSRKLIRRFSSFPGETSHVGPSEESFSITLLGLVKLGKWIESLSEIAIIMQLGLNQRVVVAKD